MASEIFIHNTIKDLYDAIGLPIDQDVDFTIHSLKEIHPEVPFKSPTFRANYYSFVFVKDAYGNYTTDDKVFDTKPGTIYFTNPGHIKAFELKEMNEAHIITLTEAFLKDHIHPDVFDEFPFLLAETVPPSVLAPEQFQAFEDLYLQIKEEYERDSPYKYKIISNLFMVILLKIKEAFWNDYNPIEEGDRSSGIVKQFKRDLEKHYRSLGNSSMNILYQVQDYARMQQLHPNYLASVIKSKTGKAAQTWIVEKTIAEATALLKNSELSAKQIGHHLGFSEATHFSSYFKKHTGHTPTSFRKTQHS